MKIKINELIKNKTTINYIAIGLVVFLFSFSLSGIVSDIKKANNELYLQNQELQLKIKEVEAPSIKLNEFIEKREVNLIKVEENNEAIKRKKEENSVLNKQREIFEKQIRCQRAVAAKMEKGDCYNEEVFSLFSL